MPTEPPAYLTVAARLLERISAGDFDGVRLPDPDQLAAEARVGRRVAQEALDVLRKQGRTEGRGRLGTWLRTPPDRQVLEVSAEQDPVVAVTLAKLEREGHQVRFVESVTISRPPDVEEMRRFSIREAQPVVVTTRCYWAADPELGPERADDRYAGRRIVHESVDVRDAEKVELREVTEVDES